MKFGKRLASEAARSHTEAYFDYKLIKKAIKEDVHSKDAHGAQFQRVLVRELQKVSQFYSSKASQLEATFSHIGANSSAELSELRCEVQELIKFVALNYLAVVKAIKKRNRHLKESFGEGASTALHALDLLIGEVFFTSPRLASLSTQAEVLSRELAARKAQEPGAAATQLLEEYQCPICLDTLHNPVVLTCAHRFCWGCLVAHCTASRDARLPIGKDQATAACCQPATSYRVLEQIAAMGTDAEPTFYPCPVCRKPQILDIDTLQVDTYLEQFITNLQAISSVSVTNNQQQPGGASPTASPRADGAGTVTVQQQQQQQHETHLKLQLVSKQKEAPVAPQPWGIIPPQLPKHRGKLTVMLDLDGTLVSSFTPKRAPRLPAYVRTHIVGVGSKLNPQGVFVVERPGLPEFLHQLAAFAEVIIYTAGLEDYAKPIIDAIDPKGTLFAARIYREGTLRTEYYQCVKDMARVNRDLSRTVLVDDTPLAFLHQPNNGIPVLGFRGDPDDRLLLEAVLPLLQVLASEPDVKPVLHRRFDMGNWFKRHGFPVEQIEAAALRSAFEERERHMAAAAAASGPQHPLAPHPVPTILLPPYEHIPAPSAPRKPVLLLSDFDKTLTDFDAGERVIEQLAPECLAMLVGIEGAQANFIPITNTLLAELQRRGVSRDALLTTLRSLGAAEFPSASAELLRHCSASGVDVKILSDCNSVFISHILAGAKVGNLVSEVLTNGATFERGAEEAGSSSSSTSGSSKSSSSNKLDRRGSLLSTTSSSSNSSTSSSGGSEKISQSATSRLASFMSRMTSGGSSSSSAPSPAPSPSPKAATGNLGHKLVVKPYHGSDRHPHKCPLCPDNLCKGTEVKALRRAGVYRSIIYAGDGFNDICATLALGPQDHVLVRKGHALDTWLQKAAAGQPGTRRPDACVHTWSSHEELHHLAKHLLRQCGGPGKQ